MGKWRVLVKTDPGLSGHVGVMHDAVGLSSVHGPGLAMLVTHALENAVRIVRVWVRAASLKGHRSQMASSRSQQSQGDGSREVEREGSVKNLACFVR